MKQGSLVLELKDLNRTAPGITDLTQAELEAIQQLKILGQSL